MAHVSILNIKSSELKPQALIDNLSSRLQPAEITRLIRFRRPDDALRFAAGRMLARKLIADAQTHTCTADIVFTESINGSKPTLSARSKASIQNVSDFNISHDGDYVLAGYTPTGVIGVDIAKVVCPAELTESQYIDQFASQ
ncbi:hypothetical protein IWW46_006194, partial [Coemansia sp. RSA 2440]